MSPPDIDAPKRISLRHNTNNYPYASSIASSASSSSSSVFSADAASSQSSAPSSVKSTENTSWEAESTSVAPHITHLHISLNSLSADGTQDAVQDGRQFTASRVQSQIAVAPELRVNPRRTQPTAQSSSQCGGVATRPPPSLVRQCDRKDNFVESLVDTTTQMIEVIWPLSVVPCERDNGLGSKNLIGLRTFIQEVLKRSKTSYSTLQVALYYLVLIKPFIPKVDFTKEQLEDSHVSRAMQCGRRMFLAALILASKYLQDRNYSARAWSKISGLKVSEINVNEIAFVKAVDWKLHIPEARFQLWTDVVLKYSLSPRSPPSSPCGDKTSDWRSIIPRLTPELDQLDMADAVSTPRISDLPCKLPMTPPESVGRRTPEWSACQRQPRATNSKPLAMEPPLRFNTENAPRFPPISPTITQLPTPSMTPTNFGTPAASSGWNCHVKSMSGAMKQVRTLAMARSTLDTWPSTVCPAMHSRRPRSSLPTPYRRSSLAPSVSSISSPESMVSDVSSRSSRSSSISSVASSAGALPQPTPLAVQATRRCANMYVAGAKEQRSETTPQWAPVWTSSPPVAMASYPYEESTIRQEESYLRHEPIEKKFDSYIPIFNIPSQADTAAAECLRSLHMNQPDQPLQCTRKQLTRKRERPTSVSDVELQQAVRAQLAYALNDISNSHGSQVIAEEEVVIDSMLAKSFVLNGFKLPETLSSSRSSHVRSISGSREGGRKRLRCVEEARGLGLSGPFGSGPGMWDGIV